MEEKTCRRRGRHRHGTQKEKRLVVGVPGGEELVAGVGGGVVVFF